MLKNITLILGLSVAIGFNATTPTRANLVAEMDAHSEEIAEAINHSAVIGCLHIDHTKALYLEIQFQRNQLYHLWRDAQNEELSFAEIGELYTQFHTGYEWLKVHIPAAKQAYYDHLEKYMHESKRK